jgi:hypothetical protein
LKVADGFRLDTMCPAYPISREDTAGRYFASLKSIRDFDEFEVRPVMHTLINPDQRAVCFRLLYQRTYHNVASLMKLDGPAHFQAINMIARSLFEIAVDFKLVGVIPDAIEKMIGFIEVEKLRCCKKVVEYKKNNPSSLVDDSIHQSYISSEGARIATLKSKLWPGIKKLDHWSNKTLKDRADLLGDPYDRIYEIEQPRMSWQVHSGLTGIANFKTETFTGLAGAAFSSSVTAYEAILTSLIKEFQIGKADEKILTKLRLAKLAPFTDSEDEAREMMREALV